MMERRLRESLGVLDVTAIASGIVIGAGLFVVTGLGAKYAGPYVWLSYLIGAIPVVLVALSTAALAAAYPVEGGESYVYPSRLVSKPLGFLSGWGMWLAIIGPVAITAQAFIQYANLLHGVSLPVVAGAVAVCAVFFVLNLLGVRLVSYVQNTLFLFLVGGIAVYVLWGLFHVDAKLLGMAAPMGLSGIVKGASILIFSYAGLTLAADLGEEATDAGRTIARACLWSAGVPIALYTLTALVSVGVLAWDAFAASDAPVGEAAAAFMGPAGITFVIIVGWAAILSSHNGEQAVSARIFFGLSRDKVIGGRLASINRFGIPHIALTISVAIAVALILLPFAFEFVVTIVVLMFLLNWIITHIAVILLPKRYPDLYEKASFKLGGPWLVVPWLGLASSVVLLIYQFIPFSSGWKVLAFGAIWLALGLLVYYLGRNRNPEEIDRLMSEWPRERYDVM